jgi:uncharacterized membrane protein
MSDLPPAPAERWRAVASGSLIALIVLCLAWELWLAPLRTGGTWLAIKVLPLAIALPGVMRGRRYTAQWTTMLMLAYFTEGVVRGWSDKGLSQQLAWIELALSVLCYAALLGYCRLTRPGTGSHTA